MPADPAGCSYRSMILYDSALWDFIQTRINIIIKAASQTLKQKSAEKVHPGTADYKPDAALIFGSDLKALPPFAYTGIFGGTSMILL